MFSRVEEWKFKNYLYQSVIGEYAEIASHILHIFCNSSVPVPIFKGLIMRDPRAQRLINLKIPVLVQLLKSSKVELGYSYYLEGRLFKCCLSVAFNP